MICFPPLEDVPPWHAYREEEGPCGSGIGRIGYDVIFTGMELASDCKSGLGPGHWA